MNRSIQGVKVEDRDDGNGIATPANPGTATPPPSVVKQDALERAPDSGLCRDLTKLLLSKAADNKQVGLCPLCNQIDFFSLAGNKFCSECETENNPCGPPEVPPPYEDGMHYHVGTLRDVSRRAGSCAGCRLILAAAAYDAVLGGRPTALDQDVTVQLDPFVKYENESNNPWASGSLALTQFSRDSFQVACDSDGVEMFIKDNLIDRAVRSVVDIELIKTWLRHCEHAHGASCAKQAAAARAHKGGDHWQKGDEDKHHRVRFIDVHEYKVVEATTRETYMALSYVWGMRNEPLLLKQTLALYSEPDGLCRVRLPRTIQDAIELTAALGQRYLWVDSLCIVQDDPADKHRQLPIMEFVYSSATAVIVAAAGAGVTAGLPGSSPSHPRTLMPRCVETLQGHEFVVLEPTLTQTLRYSRWNKRSWTYQEAALATRMLVFTDRLVYWNCQIDSWREDLQAAVGPAPATGDGSTSATTPTSPPPRTPVDETNSLSAVPQGVCQTEDYGRRVELFSGRELTNEGDALWAFRGILRMLGAGSVDGYTWALPRDRLDEALLWSATFRSSQSHERRQPCVIPTDTGFCSLPIPSWSWLSYSGQVEFKNPCEHPMVSRVEWHEPLPSEGDVAATGALPSDVAYGRLRLTANTACLQLQPWKSSWRKRLRSLSKIYWPGFRKHWAGASIHLDGGELLGLIYVPAGYFAGGSEKRSEFVLLSENTACAAEDCTVVESVNLMLVREEDGVAYRVQLTRISKALWGKVEARKRTLVLG